MGRRQTEGKGCVGRAGAVEEKKEGSPRKGGREEHGMREEGERRGVRRVGWGRKGLEMGGKGGDGGAQRKKGMRKV